MSKSFKIFLVILFLLIGGWFLLQVVGYITPAQGLFDTRCWNPQTRDINLTDEPMNGPPPSLLDCIRHGVSAIVYSGAPDSQSVRACDAPRLFGMEDDGLKYDVRLKVGEDCLDPTGLIFRFDRYYRSNNQFAGDVVVIEKKKETPITFVATRKEVESVALQGVSLTIRLCGIGESIKTPEGSVRLMVSREGDPVCPQ